MTGANLVIMCVCSKCVQACLCGIALFVSSLCRIPTMAFSSQWPKTMTDKKIKKTRMKRWSKLIVMRTGSLYWKQGVGEYKKQNNNNNNNNKNRKRDRRGREGQRRAEMGGWWRGTRGEDRWGGVVSVWVFVLLCLSADVLCCVRPCGRS